MKVFGLVIDWISSPYYQEIWNGIRTGLQQRGANLLTLVTGRIGGQTPWEARFEQLIHRVSDEAFEGFIVLTGPLAGRLPSALMERIWYAMQPKKVISIGAPLGTAPTLLVDHRPGFQQLLHHLYDEHGYRRFAFAGGPSANPDAQERLELFRQFIKEKHLEVPAEWMSKTDFSPGGGREAVAQLVPKDRPEFEVLVCANDDIALGAMEGLSQKSLKIPEDLALTGYDDMTLAGLASLTTASQSLFELGQKAVELLWEEENGNESTPKASRDSVLVVRRSCGCLPKGDRDVSPLDSQLHLVESIIRQRVSRDQLADLTDLMVNSKNPRDQRAHLERFLPEIGVRRFLLSLEGEVRLDKTRLGPEPWSFVEETLYDRNTVLGALLLDLGEDTEMLTLVADIAERVARGVETVHRINHLETQVAQRTAELRELALRDELTRLYNRRGFLALAEHQLRSNRRNGFPLVLFYGDLDGLKAVNDTWGHDAGDEAIRTAARILLESFRAEDLVARMGGDEFVMLAAGCTPEDAKGLATRIAGAFAHESNGRYGISLGWIEIDPRAKKSLEEWLIVADGALYRAKQAKKAGNSSDGPGL